MANHVTTYVHFVEMNEEARNHLKEMYTRLRTSEDRQRIWFGDIFVKDKTDYDSTETYDFMVEKVGAKWAYFEEYDESGFSVCSAWSYPSDGIAAILSELAEFDPKMITTTTYEDEMPNFVGCEVYFGDVLEDGSEWDDEEILDEVMHRIPELLGKYDEVEQEWVDEESEDVYRDNLYETIYLMQHEVIESVVKYLRT